MYKLTGAIKLIKDEEVVSEKFKKREFVITDASSMYPQDVSFQLAQDKCSLADSLKEGQQIEVSFNIRGREWISPKGEMRHFNTLEAWRIEPVTGGEQSPPDLQNEAIDYGRDDGLPF